MTAQLQLCRPAFCLVLAIVSGPVVSVAQGPSSHHLEIGVDVGPTLHQPEDPRGYLTGCLTSRPNVSYNGAIRYLFGGRWALTAAFSGWPGYRITGPCIQAAPPRALGADTLLTYPGGSHELTFPIHLTTLGVARELWRVWAIGLWLDAGIGRNWAQHLWAPQAALRVGWRRGWVQPVVSAGLVHYAFDRLSVAYLYQNGQEMGVDSTALRVHETQWLLRAGVAIPIHR
jgi:hypothetical protein